MAAQRAAILFGCYRRGDANDPDTYCAAVAATLSRFSASVVEYVTDPRTGIPGSCEWLPSVAEVKAACVAREDYLVRLRDLDRRFGGRKPLLALPLDRDRPGRRANVFVPAGTPFYDRACKIAETADIADYKRDPEGRPGIWIALHLWEAPATKRPAAAASDWQNIPVSPYLAATLRAQEAQQEAAQ